MRSDQPSRMKAFVITACVALGLALAGLTGCASEPSFSSSNANDEFVAGINRPPTAHTLFAMGRILAAQGKDNEAEFVLARTLHEYPDFAPAYNELAELYMRSDRFDDGIRVLMVGLDHLPDDAVLTNNLGMCFLLQGNHERALDLFTQAHTLAPNEDRYRANMATALGLMGRYDESLDIYQQILPDASQAHHNLAVLCEARNDIGRAAEEHAKAKALK